MTESKVDERDESRLQFRGALAFIAPEDQVLAMSAVPELVGDAGGQAAFDRKVGLQVHTVAQLSFLDANGNVRSSMFASRSELARIVTELRALYEAMGDCQRAVDRGWQRYRDVVRSRALADDGGGDVDGAGDAGD